MQQKFTVAVIVENHFGVLMRVAGLFSKRCYNIDSLAVGETEDSKISRMTIVVSGDDYVKEQIVKQLKKLYDVKSVILLENEDAVKREHVMIKLNANNGDNEKITDMISKYGGKVIDFGNNTITFDVTDDADKVDELIALAKGIGIIELCRSGVIALSKTN